VVVNRHGELLLGCVLPDDVLVEEGFDFQRLGELVGSGGGGVSFGAIILKDGVADGYALVTDISPGLIAGGGDQFGDGVLRFMAKRTTQHFVGTRPAFHRLYSFRRTLCRLTCSVRLGPGFARHLRVA